MDECENCVLRGYVSDCNANECSKHDSWYAKAMIAENAELKTLIKQITKDRTEEAQQCGGEVAELKVALMKISTIDDNLTGGDWDEIEEARSIAKAALCQTSTKSIDAIKAEVEDETIGLCAIYFCSDEDGSVHSATTMKLLFRNMPRKYGEAK